jgi:hypothetical protein
MKAYAEVDNKTKALLEEWNVNFIILVMFDIQMRSNQYILEIKKQ